MILELASPVSLFFSEKVNSVCIPGVDGYFTVMNGHINLLSALKPGIVTCKGNNTRKFYVDGGIAKIGETKTIVLAEYVCEVNQLGAEKDRLLAEAKEILSAPNNDLDLHFAESVVRCLGAL